MSDKREVMQWAMSAETGILYPLATLNVRNAEAIKYEREIAARNERHRIEMEEYEAKRWRESRTGKAHAELMLALETGVGVFEAARQLATAGYDDEMDRCQDETTGCHYFHTCEDYW